jgi:hypothetical protein
MQHRLREQVVRPDAWSLFCAECLQKMRIMMATPAQAGRVLPFVNALCGTDVQHMR